jgi:hypothetical protein
VFIFMYVVYRTLTDYVVVPANCWHSKEFFTAEGDAESVTTLEWVQQSPPALHTYNELPYLVATKA